MQALTQTQYIEQTVAAAVEALLARYDLTASRTSKPIGLVVQNLMDDRLTNSVFRSKFSLQDTAALVAGADFCGLGLSQFGPDAFAVDDVSTLVDFVPVIVSKRTCDQMLRADTGRVVTCVHDNQFIGQDSVDLLVDVSMRSYGPTVPSLTWAKHPIGVVIASPFPCPAIAGLIDKIPELLDVCITGDQEVSALHATEHLLLVLWLEELVAPMAFNWPEERSCFGGARGIAMLGLSDARESLLPQSLLPAEVTGKQVRGGTLGLHSEFTPRCATPQTVAAVLGHSHVQYYFTSFANKEATKC